MQGSTSSLLPGTVVACSSGNAGTVGTKEPAGGPVPLDDLPHMFDELIRRVEQARERGDQEEFEVLLKKLIELCNTTVTTGPSSLQNGALALRFGIALARLPQLLLARGVEKTVALLLTDGAVMLEGLLSKKGRMAAAAEYARAQRMTRRMTRRQALRELAELIYQAGKTRCEDGEKLCDDASSSRLFRNYSKLAVKVYRMSGNEPGPQLQKYYESIAWAYKSMGMFSNEVEYLEKALDVRRSWNHATTTAAQRRLDTALREQRNAQIAWHGNKKRGAGSISGENGEGGGGGGASARSTAADDEE
jgi:tetratricopeptide (TPR) repeat protein